MGHLESGRFSLDGGCCFGERSVRSGLWPALSFRDATSRVERLATELILHCGIIDDYLVKKL